MSAPQTPSARSPARRRSGVVVPHRATWRQRIAAWAVYAALRVVALTVRVRLHDASGQFTNIPATPFIFAVWHNRLALSLPLYRRYVRRLHPGRRMAALVSASRDGAFLARILELFGVQPVRGSTSRRGPQALRELVSWSERGYDLTITPDGPRGPRYTVQEGAVALAQLTGLPVVPASYRLRWRIRAPSWDRFEIPLPFTRCDLRVGSFLRVPREAAGAEREAFRQQLENALRELTGE